MSVIASSLPAGVVRADEGERHGFAGHAITFKSLGSETGGGAFIWEIQSPPGTMVPPHIHRVEDEFIYLVEGQLEVTVGDQTHTLGGGDLAKMRRSVPHAIRMTGTGPARTLWTVVPAGKMADLALCAHRLGTALTAKAIFALGRSRRPTITLRRPAQKRPLAG